MAAGTGKLIKQRRLSAILVSRQGKGEYFPIWKGILIRLVVVFSSFTKSRVRNGLPFRYGTFFRLLPHISNLYLLCIGKAQSQFIAMYPQFHRITHRRIFYHRYIRFRNQPHI